MLADFMFTPKQQRVLAAVLLHPERDYSFTELQEKVSGGHSSLQAFLDTLFRAGVVNVRQQRSSKRYKVNTEHPLFPELQSIAIKSFAVLEPVRAALAPLAQEIQKAFIFGSMVNGTASHESDIDLMVIGSVRVGELRMAMKDVEQLTGRQIHINAYDPDEWSRMIQDDPVIKSIAEGPTLELHLATDSANGHERVDRLQLD